MREKKRCSWAGTSDTRSMYFFRYVVIWCKELSFKCAARGAPLGRQRHPAGCGRGTPRSKRLQLKSLNTCFWHGLALRLRVPKAQKIYFNVLGFALEE